MQQSSVPSLSSSLSAQTLQPVHSNSKPLYIPLPAPNSLLTPPKTFNRSPEYSLLPMGICTSFETTPLFPITTAKLVLFNGDLKEFSSPVKAAHALQKDAGFFVCDADMMEFGGFLPAVADDVELRPGQIYFVLPRSMLRQRLQAADLAALAVKASSAIVKAGKGVEKEFVFLETRFEMKGTASLERRRRRRSGGSGRSFESNLCSIDE